MAICLGCMAMEVNKGAHVAKYRIGLALAFGAGFPSLWLLLVKLWPVFIVSLLMGIFLSPGGFLSDFILKPKDVSPPAVVLAVNVALYSAIAYVALSIFWRVPDVPPMRRLLMRLAVPAAILLGLACVPALNPLWPRGMMELENQEKELQTAVPVGVGLDEVRVVLRSKRIQFYESTEERQEVVLDNGKGESVTAAPGDRVISARFQTPASQFPCGYDMQIVLLFGRDDKLKQQYIHRFRICP